MFLLLTSRPTGEDGRSERHLMDTCPGPDIRREKLLSKKEFVSMKGRCLGLKVFQICFRGIE